MASYEELKPNKKGLPGIKIYVEHGYDEETGERIRFTKTVRMKKLSERAIKKAITEFEIEVANKQKTNKTSNMTFKQFVDLWLCNYVRPDLSTKTKDDYIYHLENGIYEELANRKLSSIKTFYLVECINKWKENSMNMALAKYVVLKSIFSKAIEWKVLKENPMEGIKPPKVKRQKSEMQFYDEEELTNLFNILEKENMDPKFILQIKIAAGVGLRAGEIAGIRLECLDFDNNTILIDKSLKYDSELKKVVLGSTKNKKARLVDVPEKLMLEIKKYAERQEKLKKELGTAWKPMRDEKGNPYNFLFTRRNGYPLNPRTISNEWILFLKKYNLKKISFHDLRHSYASYMLSKNVNYKIIQEQLGHGNIDITINTYSHLTKKDKKNASSLFNELFSNQHQEKSNSI